MKESYFNRSKFAAVMGYKSFLILDKLLWDASPLPVSSKVPSSKCFGNSKGSNLLTSVVIKYIKLIGGHAIRINSTGMMREVRGRKIWTKGSSKGVADIQAIIEGVPVMIEIKLKRDKQSEVQQEYQKQVERSGGKYIIVKTLDTLIEYLETLKQAV